MTWDLFITIGPPLATLALSIFAIHQTIQCHALMDEYLKLRQNYMKLVIENRKLIQKIHAQREKNARD